MLLVSHSFRLAKAEVYFPASTRVERVERSYRLDRSRILLICEIEVICSVIGTETRALLNNSEVRDSLVFDDCLDDHFPAHRPQRIVICSIVSSFTVTAIFHIQYCKIKPNCPDRATLVAEQVPTGPREELPENDEDLQ